MRSNVLCIFWWVIFILVGYLYSGGLYVLMGYFSSGGPCSLLLSLPLSPSLSPSASLSVSLSPSRSLLHFLSLSLLFLALWLSLSPSLSLSLSPSLSLSVSHSRSLLHFLSLSLLLFFSLSRSIALSLPSWDPHLLSTNHVSLSTISSSSCLVANQTWHIRWKTPTFLK